MSSIITVHLTTSSNAEPSPEYRDQGQRLNLDHSDEQHTLPKCWERVAHVERTLRIEIGDEAFDRLYGFESHPIKVKGDDHQIAVRIISQFGEESTKVLDV